MDKPTILFISKFIPAPTFDGGALRTKAWLEFLLKKYHVVLVGFWNKKYGDEQLADLKHDNLEIHGVNFKTNLLKKFYLLFKLLFLNKSFLLCQYYNKQLEKKVFEIIDRNKIDFVFCSELSTMQYINGLDKNLPIYFDDHNVEFRLIERMSENQHGLKKFILCKESKLVKNFEYRCVKNSTKTFVVSRVDKEFLFNSFDIERENIEVVNNVFADHGGFKQNNLSNVPRLVFVGNLNWAPNKDGLSRFLTNIFPKVLKEIPNIELDILGSNLPRIIVNRTKDLPVNFLEEISNKDKEKTISSAWIGIVPLYFASGSRIKILEFWSHGKCVVTTNVGLEGLPCPDGTLTADSDQEFVDQLINILKHKEKLQTLGSSNYLVFKQNYLKKVVYEDTLYNTFSAE